MRPRKDRNDLVVGGKQLAILQAVFSLKNDAYGGGIFVYLAEQGDKTVLPQIYSALAKLESDGLVEHEFSQPRNVRGGRRRKIYRITGKGHRILRDSLTKAPRSGSRPTWVFPGLRGKQQT